MRFAPSAHCASILGVSYSVLASLSARSYLLLFHAKYITWSFEMWIASIATGFDGRIRRDALLSTSCLPRLLGELYERGRGCEGGCAENAFCGINEQHC